MGAQALYSAGIPNPNSAGQRPLCQSLSSAMRLLVFVVAVTSFVAGEPGCKETLVEHEYGLNHKQFDDGTCYTPSLEVSRYDPSFAQGYFLEEAAKGSDNAKCLDGTPALYYHRKGTGSGSNKWFLHQQGGGWCYDLE